MAVVDAGEQTVQGLAGRGGQRHEAQDMDFGILYGRREVSRCGIAVYLHQAAGSQRQIGVSDPEEYTGRVVLEKGDLVLRRGISDDALQMDGILPACLLRGESSDLGDFGQGPGADLGWWLAQSLGRQQYCDGEGCQRAVPVPYATADRVLQGNRHHDSYRPIGAITI